MGIAPYKTFTFDGESSADYDVYLTGVGVFDSPERDVEMIEILGRNGNFALDRGRFRNVSVKYKIGMYDLNESNFATKVSAFRNWLCSKVGYVRLSDDYNPNEYRMAVYASGFELKHDFLIAGEAEITFDCKPQRWLTSGETATAVTSGGTLTNPTLFEASPLLEVVGYGNININGAEISVENVLIGDVLLVSQRTETTTVTEISFEGNLLDVGNNLTVDHVEFNMQYSPTNGATYVVLSNGHSATNCTASIVGGDQVQMSLDAITFTKGTSDTFTASYKYSVTWYGSGGPGITSCTASVAVAYDGDGTITITVSGYGASHSKVSKTIAIPDITANSTKSALGNPMYIDLDIGEVWNEDYGEPVSVNNAVSLGSELPTLPTGTTTITYDNTITSLKVAPRWWQV